jgi:hypothetical protein
MTINSVALLLLGPVIAFLGTWFWRYRTRVDDAAAARGEQIATLQKQVTVLETQVKPLWDSTQSRLAKDLTHPSPQFKEADALLGKLQAHEIEESERQRLLVLLAERARSTDPEVSPAEKESARIMPIVMKKALSEARSGDPEMIAVNKERRKPVPIEPPEAIK